MSFLYLTTKTEWINKVISVNLDAENLLDTVVTNASLAPRVKGIASTITKIQQGGIQVPRILGFLINSIADDVQSLFLAIYVLTDDKSDSRTYWFRELYVVDHAHTAGSLWYYDDKTFSVTVTSKKQKDINELLYFTYDPEKLMFSVTTQAGEVVEIDEYPTPPSVVDAKAISTISFDNVELDELLQMERVLKHAIALRRAMKLTAFVRGKNIDSRLALFQLSELIDDMLSDTEAKVPNSNHVQYLSKTIDIAYNLLPGDFKEELNI